MIESDKGFGIIEPKIQPSLLFLIVIAVGILLRYLCGLQTPNYDFYSWEIVSDLFIENKNIYNNTFRYNYGPIWFNVIGYLRQTGFDFRFCLISFLTFIDVVIFILIWNLGKVKESILFFLCPVGIIISGYHHQFENFSILTAFYGVYYVIKKYRFTIKFDDISFGDTVFLSILIGLSLVVKHIFILFPIWMFFQTHNLYKRMVVLIVPILIFFASFLLYWSEGKSGIISNVFGYSSFNNFPFYQIVYSDLFIYLNGLNNKILRIIFFLIIISVGFVLRKRSILDSFLFYTAFFVCFSSAITNQYLVIPVIFLSFYYYSSAVIYYIVGCIMLVLFDEHGLHLLTDIDSNSFLEKLTWFKIIIFFLFLNILSSIKGRDYFNEFLSSLYRLEKRYFTEFINEVIYFLGSIKNKSKR